MLTRILLLLVLLAPIPALAQDDVVAAEEDDGIICVGVATLWSGSPTEVRDIERDPVPETFRRPYESTSPCNSLVSGSLIDWHLRFGSERSAVAALEYLERGRGRVIRSPQRHVEELERAWRAAQRDLARARQIRAAVPTDHVQLARFLRASETIARLRSLADTSQSGYLFLAEQYLRVAEEHGSLSLLEKAERLLSTDQAGMAFLARVEEGSLEDDLLGRPEYLRLKAADVEMRAAVLSARLTRSAEAIARAEATLRMQERPQYLRFARSAFEYGDDFCDTSPDENDALRLECRSDDEPNLQERVVNYLAARAELDLIKGDAATLKNWGAFEALMPLLAAERYFDRSRCCRGRTNVELTVALSLALAEYHGRRLATREEMVDNDPLETLSAAERLVPPYEEPTRFRRIAAAWLARYRQVASVLAEDRGISHRDKRYAAYLQHTLRNLDAIAQADGNP